MKPTLAKKNLRVSVGVVSGGVWRGLVVGWSCCWAASMVGSLALSLCGCGLWVGLWGGLWGERHFLSFRIINFFSPFLVNNSRFVTS